MLAPTQVQKTARMLPPTQDQDTARMCHPTRDKKAARMSPLTQSQKTAECLPQTNEDQDTAMCLPAPGYCDVFSPMMTMLQCHCVFFPLLDTAMCSPPPAGYCDVIFSTIRQRMMWQCVLSFTQQATEQSWSRKLTNTLFLHLKLNKSSTQLKNLPTIIPYTRTLTTVTALLPMCCTCYLG